MKKLIVLILGINLYGFTVAQNVGVGTSLPIMKLHVVNTDSAVAVFENSQILNTNVGTGLYFKTGNGPFQYTGAMKTIGTNISGARLALFTYASNRPDQLLERLSILDNGSVGIGTTAPDASALLDLSSTSKGLLLPRVTEAQKNAISSPKPGLIIYQTNGNNGIYIYTLDGWIHQISETSTDNAWQFNGQNIYATNTGNVGIGTQANSLAKFTVGTNSTAYGLLHTDGNVLVGTYVNPSSGQFGTKSNHRLSFFTNNSGEQMTLLQNGNLGLNTTAPQTKLHVNPAGAGSILVGTNKTSGGFTNLEIGISAASGGNGFIQATKAAGTAGGSLLLNPNGGNVQINFPSNSNSYYPLDINQTSQAFGIRLRNNISNYQHDWDIYSSVTTFSSPAVGLFFAFNGQTRSYIVANDGSYNTVSDARFKTNIQNIGNVMERVMQLQAKSYEVETANIAPKASTGFIAQEVLPLFPDLISTFEHPTKDTSDQKVYYGINYAGFGVIAIKAVQEQQVIIEALQKQIGVMHKDIEALNQLIKIGLPKTQ
jgi:hypothetical protein